MNISSNHNCFGCGVCAIACSRKIINIQLNADGFYEPALTDASKCTDCGICVDVCSYSHDELALKNPVVNSYAAWSNNPTVRRTSTSGGVGFELGKYIIFEGGKVCGVRYNIGLNIAEHYVATTEEELRESVGSKYIQSYTVNGFRDIVKQLHESRKKNENPTYLVIGTPCQIDSFRRYIQKFRIEDGFLLMDFYCHGVPSKLMWDKYFRGINTNNASKITWRNKINGWHNSYVIKVENEKECIYQSKFGTADLFFDFFIHDSCLGKSCYDRCRFKYDQSAADLRIGDAWGTYFKEEEKGVNVLISFTQRANMIIRKLNCKLIELDMSIVAGGQMRENPHRPLYYELFRRFLKYKKIRIQDMDKVRRVGLKLGKIENELSKIKTRIKRLHEN